MKARFAQQLQLLHVAEAVEVVDQARIRAGRHPAAAALVVVEEAHPRLVELLPVVFVFAGPQQRFEDAVEWVTVSSPSLVPRVRPQCHCVAAFHSPILFSSSLQRGSDRREAKRGSILKCRKYSSRSRKACSTRFSARVRSPRARCTSAKETFESV